MAAAEEGDAAFGVAFQARDAEPEDVHRRRGLQHLEAAEVAHARAATVGPDRERRAQLVPAFAVFVPDAAHDAALLYKPLDARAHPHLERGVSLRLLDDEGEEVFLREHHDVGEARLEASEVGERHGAFRGQESPGVDFRVTEFVQSLGQSEFVQQFEDGRVYGVAPKVSVEIFVRFEERDADALAREQQ